MDMRDLTKSVLTLPWALSMFGVQQAVNLVSPSTQDRFGEAGRALDAVSDAAAGQFDGWARDTYQLGDAFQRTMVDLALLKLPDLDPRALTPLAASMQSNPLFQAVMKYGLPPVGWVDSLLVPGVDSPAVSQEFRNKLTVVLLIAQLDETLGLAGRRDELLTATVARSAEMATFPRLWAIEGIGSAFADQALARSGAETTALLTGPDTHELPRWSVAMLHAGIGTSFAKFALKDFTSTTTPEAVREAVSLFIALCKGSSRPGCMGAACSSLGLTARTLHPSQVPLLDSELRATAPDLSSYFWHGVGRGAYFDPANLLPSHNAPWRAVRSFEQEAPAADARRNLVAGFAWALTAVNMPHPVVMEAFLRHHADLVTADDAFANGVASSVMVRYDATHDDARLAPFIHHAPADAADATELWRARITQPCEDALQTTYPHLREARRIDELFRYRSAS